MSYTPPFEGGVNPYVQHDEYASEPLVETIDDILNKPDMVDHVWELVKGTFNQHYSELAQQAEARAGNGVQADVILIARGVVEESIRWIDIAKISVPGQEPIYAGFTPNLLDTKDGMSAEPTAIRFVKPRNETEANDGITRLEVKKPGYSYWHLVTVKGEGMFFGGEVMFERDKIVHFEEARLGDRFQVVEARTKELEAVADALREKQRESIREALADYAHQPETLGIQDFMRHIEAVKENYLPEMVDLAAAEELRRLTPVNIFVQSLQIGIRTAEADAKRQKNFALEYARSKNPDDLLARDNSYNYAQAWYVKVSRLKQIAKELGGSEAIRGKSEAQIEAAAQKLGGDAVVRIVNAPIRAQQEYARDPVSIWIKYSMAKFKQLQQRKNAKSK